MARVRPLPASDTPAARPKSPQVSPDLARLLRARSFCLGEMAPALLARLTANLQVLGGASDPDAPAWIGEAPPPPGRPSISLGDEPGTLGPRSFGFLNNVDGIAPLVTPAPMAERPRRGGVAVVVPRRDALPEVVPLLRARRLGISWLISVGDGDPAEALRFLAVDPATSGILVALGRGARAATLHGALGGKQTALLDLGSSAGPGREGGLCRAVARRAGAAAVSGLEDWLAYGTLFDSAALAGAPASRRASVAILVLGAGTDFVAAEAQRMRLPAPVAVDGEDREEVQRALAQASLDAELLLLCGPVELTAELQAPARPLLRVDPASPERLRALFQAVAQRRLPAAAGDRKPLPVKADAERLGRILADLPPPLYVGNSMVTEETLSDHDTKRFLHAYGVRVSRQAPANTVTAIVRIAAQIGLPAVLVAPAGEGEGPGEHPCASQAELKRQATLLLSRCPHVMVREHFPEAPRARLQVAAERGLGRVLRLGSEAALLPLLRGEARELAEPLGLLHDFDDKGLTDLLCRVSACATEQALALDLELHLSEAPAVVGAAGTLKRPKPA